MADDAGSIIVRPAKGNGLVPTWTHDTLLNIAGGKLRRLLLVKGERNGQRARFVQADCFEDLHLTLLAIEMVVGTIAVDFDAREDKPGSKALRNHGTKFRVAPDNVCRLYLKNVEPAQAASSRPLVPVVQTVGYLYKLERFKDKDYAYDLGAALTSGISRAWLEKTGFFTKEEVDQAYEQLQSISTTPPRLPSRPAGHRPRRSAPSGAHR